jgi:hypothetical protein
LGDRRFSHGLAFEMAGGLPNPACRGGRSFSRAAYERVSNERQVPCCAASAIVNNVEQRLCQTKCSSTTEPDMRNSERATIPRVSAEELRFAVGVACAATAMKGPYPTPTVQHLTMQDDDTGEVTTYRFANPAVARGGFAVMQEFDQEPGKGIALLMRWSELTRLIHDQRMQPYMREAPDGSGAVDLRPEVLEVAAELSFDVNRGFDEHSFFRTLDARVTARRQAPLADADAGQSGVRGDDQHDGAPPRRAVRPPRNPTGPQLSATE